MVDELLRLDSEAVGFLLELLDLEQPMLSGAAAEMRPAAVAGLAGAGLLADAGHERVSASLADDDDVPVSLIPGADGCGYGYFSPAMGWVAVPNERLKLFRVDVNLVLRRIAVSLALPRGWSPNPLVPGLLWELGDARIGRRTQRVPLWFTRRAFDAACWRQVAAMAQARPHVRQRVILTSTRGSRLPPDIDGHLAVPLRDVLAAPPAFVVDPDILDARLGGVPVGDATRPIVLSPDGTQLVINGGGPILFRSRNQIDAIRRLVDAYYAGKRLRAADLTDRSLQTMFGHAKWTRLSPYLKSVNGLWGFEP
jgi:hypothetical protein